VVSKVEVDYKFPAKYGDIINISARVDYIKRSSLSFYQEIKRDENLLIRANTLWVCVDSSFKPRVIPDYIRSLFSD